MDYKEFQTPLADNDFKESFDSVDYYVVQGMEKYVDGFKKEGGSLKISENLSKYDSISLKDTHLIANTGDNEIDLALKLCHFRSLKKSIIDQLGDEEKRTLIKELEESLCK